MDKFNDLFLKERTIPAKQQKGYHVYSDKDKFSFVEATTAAEALVKSGIKEPYKIVPAGVVTKAVFAKAEIAEITKAPENPSPPAA